MSVLSSTLHEVVHSGNAWMITRADNEVEQMNPESGTATEGRSIGHVRDKSAPTDVRMQLFICIIGTYGFARNERMLHEVEGLNKGDTMTLVLLENDGADSSQHMHLHSPVGVESAGYGRQPILTLRVGAQQDPGIRRRYRPNEDTLFVTQGIMPSASTAPKPFVLLVVADGMGGREHGRKASRLATWSLVGHVSGSLCREQRLPEDLLSLLTIGVQSANRVVYEYNQQQGTTMGTTMTAALVIETTTYVAHVGDSRLYLYREPTGLAQITRDHSVVAELVARGLIAPDDIYTHPMRNQIYRCLGSEASVEVDASVVPLAEEDVLLLCSDGLWEMVRDQQIAAIMTTPNPSDTAHALIQAAMAGGGEDNVSAIVARVSNV